MSARLIYVMDPMCSWCWGLAPVMQALAEQAANRGVGLHLVVGGLRRERTPMDEAGRRRTLAYWQAVHEASGQPFDFAAGLPEGLVYDTEPACRALVAARQLEAERAWPLALLIQQAFYTRSEDVTQPARLVELAERTAPSPSASMPARHAKPLLPISPGPGTSASPASLPYWPSVTANWPC